MKLFLLSLFIIPFSYVLSAQSRSFEAPDYEVIEKAIADEESNLFYDSLMTRFQQGDSTLSLEEKRYLYYGYIFQDDYSPYGRSLMNDTLRSLLQKEKLDSLELRTVIRLTNPNLAEHPFDLKALNYQLFAYDELGDDEAYWAARTKYFSIFDALFSTGDGASKETAIYVIETAHEYAVLNVLGFEFGGKQSLIEHYDYLTLLENEYDLEGLYFDITPCLNHLNSMFDD